jgi:hypothetical protein
MTSLQSNGTIEIDKSGWILKDGDLYYCNNDNGDEWLNEDILQAKIFTCSIENVKMELLNSAYGIYKKNFEAIYITGKFTYKIGESINEL